MVQLKSSYQKVHHVRLIIPQCLHSMEYVNSPLMSKHFTNNTDCTKCPTAATSIPAVKVIKWLSYNGLCVTSLYSNRDGSRRHEFQQGETTEHPWPQGLLNSRQKMIFNWNKHAEKSQSYDSEVSRLIDWRELNG